MLLRKSDLNNGDRGIAPISSGYPEAVLLTFPLSSLFSITIFFITLYFLMDYDASAILETNNILAKIRESNVRIYACALLAFAASFVAFRFLLGVFFRKKTQIVPIWNRPLSINTQRLFAGIIILISSALLLHRQLFAELNEFAIPSGALPTHQFPKMFITELHI